MKVLVTGISGLGGHLAPHLLAAGHDVRGLSRDPDRVAIDVPVVQGDAATGAGIDRAMEGVEVAYFLINTYERSNTEGFVVRDRRVARTFATAAARAGVRRIVYLGVPPAADPARSSRHIDSRLDVEDILMNSGPEAVSLGVFTIASPRSRSLRVLFQTLRTYPVVPLPPWRNNRIQPMDIRDVFDCLIAAASEEAVAGKRLVIGGPETMTWGLLLRRLADAMRLRRTFVPLPFGLPRPVEGLLAEWNGGNPALITPLMETLNTGDLTMPRNDAAALGVPLRPIRQTIDDAAAEFLRGDWRRTEGSPFEPVRSLDR